MSIAKTFKTASPAQAKLDSTHILTKKQPTGTYIVSYWLMGERHETPCDGIERVVGVVRELLRDGMTGIKVDAD